MGYVATTGVIIYWKPDTSLFIHRYHHIWFDEYNSHTTGSFIPQQYPESIINHSDLLNLIPCELDITSTPFFDTIILTYKIELPPSGKKIGFNLLDDEYFTIPYITDTIPNSPAGNKIPIQAKICVDH